MEQAKVSDIPKIKKKKKMILKLKEIKDFGSFKHFVWNDAQINSFKKRNLIYGWNYSGKTTFSKLFSNLEERSKIYFPNSEYKFEIEENAKIYTQEQLAAFPYLVKVFNSIYEKNIFSWDKENNGGFNAIRFYLGDEAGNIQPKIDSLRNRWNPRIEAIQEKNKAIIFSFEEYEKESGKFSKKSTEIRRYLDDQIKANDFNKSHFSALAKEVKSNLTQYLLPSQNVIEFKQQAIAKDEHQRQDANFKLTEALTIIGKNVKEVLEDSAPTSVPFPELDKNKELFNWVQKGLDLHQESNKCWFCDNDLRAERVQSLNQFYTDKLKKIQGTIAKIRQNIDDEKKKLDFTFPHSSQIASHLRDKYKQAVESYNTQQLNYIKQLEVFENDLERKEENYFNPIGATTFDNLTMEGELDKITEIIQKHNSFVNEFNNTKNQAKGLILRHYVAEYLHEEEYLKKEEEAKTASILMERCQKRIKENNNEITRLENQLKNTVKGQEELNIYLKIFLNRDDIQIAIEQDKFILKRGEHKATNLSEGEKTAIAFAYFLTELKSLQSEGKLKDTIIFFDDPISSLDSNHIFQVRSLIQDFFKDDGRYRQLFISTHNFEFFSVMRDTNLFKKRDKKEPKFNYYLINRMKEDASIIKELPKTLRSHKSEYAHLFSILKEYNDSQDKDTFEYKILLPNALRRFLELYTLFKYPKGSSEVDERIKKIFSPEDGAFHNTKLYHWFSHQQQFEKVGQHDEKITLIDDAINEILQHIQTKDQSHWEGLTES